MTSRQIFMGDGERSMAQAYDLHRKLERSLEIISGLQQGAEGNGGERVELAMNAAFIFTALTGKSLTVKQVSELV
jgi:hypothetical protein